MKPSYTDRPPKSSELDERPSTSAILLYRVGFALETPSLQSIGSVRVMRIAFVVAGLGLGALLAGCGKSDSSEKEGSAYVEPNPPECAELGALTQTCDERATDDLSVVSCMEYLDGVNAEEPYDHNFYYRCPAAKVAGGSHCEPDAVIGECVIRIATDEGDLIDVGRKFFYESTSKPPLDGENVNGTMKTLCSYGQPNNFFCATPTR